MLVCLPFELVRAERVLAVLSQGSGGRDGCHPDDTGYGQLAAAVKDAITAGRLN